MRFALEQIGEVTTLTHRSAWRPRMHASGAELVLGTQPLTVHTEAMLAGRLHRRPLRRWSAAWVVNSRYAGSLWAAGVPYIVWEATPIADELAAVSTRDVRRAERGSGVGRALHGALLPIGQAAEGAIYRRAFRLLAMSDYTRERMVARHGLSPERVAVLPHPPTAEYLAALDWEREQGSAVSAESELRLLFVGRVDDPRKNVGLLLDTCRRLTSEGVALTLTIVGPYSEPWRKRIDADLRGLGATVRLRGTISTAVLARAYLGHDLLLLTSRQEGFGIVVAEALHAGLPVVSTRSGGPEGVLRASGAGVLCDHDPKALAAAVRELAAAPERRSAMSARGRAFAERELDLASFVRRVTALTQELLARQDHASPV